ncbi:MAG: YceI family protein [Geminicoccaceae bacterium]
MSLIFRNVFVALVVWLGSTSGHAASNWTMDPAQSSLGFIGQQGSTEFEGRFADFNAEIAFSPDDLGNSSVRVEVDVTSASTGTPERDSQLGATTWFNFAEFPKAVYQAEGFTADGDGYRADGTLTLKGVSRDVPIEFTIAIDGDRAVAEGSGTLVRTNFEVGQGEFASGNTVALDVRVVFEIHANRSE